MRSHADHRNDSMLWLAQWQRKQWRQHRRLVYFTLLVFVAVVAMIL